MSSWEEMIATEKAYRVKSGKDREKQGPGRKENVFDELLCILGPLVAQLLLLLLHLFFLLFQLLLLFLPLCSCSALVVQANQMVRQHCLPKNGRRILGDEWLDDVLRKANKFVPLKAMKGLMEWKTSSSVLKKSKDKLQACSLSAFRSRQRACRSLVAWTKVGDCGPKVTPARS